MNYQVTYNFCDLNVFIDFSNFILILLTFVFVWIRFYTKMSKTQEFFWFFK